ncbi:MAG: hypothetical protein EBR82_09660 [Caulobacteraceae bacterium]|nr:hypothetical protein [Caulobacteraceae bacterium]
MTDPQQQALPPACIAQIRDALNPRDRFKPTPGEWVADGREGWAYPNTVVRTAESREDGGHDIVRVHADFTCTVGKSEYEWANAAFVAACSPDNIRSLLAYVEQLEALAASAPSREVPDDMPEAFDPSASHISPDYRDGWNACHKAMSEWAMQDRISVALAATTAVTRGTLKGEIQQVRADESISDWQHLKRYGYAPGNYMSKCLKCGKTTIMDKRAYRCRPCAEARHAAAPSPSVAAEETKNA